MSRPEVGTILKCSVVLLFNALVWTATLAWAIVPHPWQGRVVLVISPTHGVHSTDLPPFTVAVLTSLVSWHWWRSSVMPTSRRSSAR